MGVSSSVVFRILDYIRDLVTNELGRCFVCFQISQQIIERLKAEAKSAFLPELLKNSFTFSF